MWPFGAFKAQREMTKAREASAKENAESALELKTNIDELDRVLRKLASPKIKAPKDV